MDMGLDQAMGKPADGGDVTDVMSPEQKQQYKKVFNMGRMLLTDEKFMATAQRMLETFPSPVEAMGQMLSAVVARIALQAQEEGEPVDALVLLISGSQLMDKVYEFTERAGVEVTEDMKEDAFYRAADLFGDIAVKKGLVSEEELAEAEQMARAEIGDEEFDKYTSRAKGVMQANMPGGGQPQQPAPEQEMM